MTSLFSNIFGGGPKSVASDIENPTLTPVAPPKEPRYESYEAEIAELVARRQQFVDALKASLDAQLDSIHSNNCDNKRWTIFLALQPLYDDDAFSKSHKLWCKGCVVSLYKKWSDIPNDVPSYIADPRHLHSLDGMTIKPSSGFYRGFELKLELAEIRYPRLSFDFESHLKSFPPVLAEGMELAADCDKMAV